MNKNFFEFAGEHPFITLLGIDLVLSGAARIIWACRKKTVVYEVINADENVDINDVGVDSNEDGA